jgi:integrase/recombinase XerD
MDKLTVTPHPLVIQLENGSRYEASLPGIAAFDRRLLTLWLHGKSEKTVIAYTKDIAKFYQTIGKSLQETTLEDLHNFNTSLFHMKTSSRARTMATLKSVLTFGTKAGILEGNAGIMFKLPKVEDTLAERIMSEKNIDEMLRLETNKRNHAMLSLLYYAGLRVSEICNLTWRNLQERNLAGQISVFGKGKKTRHILLDTETWREVWALRNGASLHDYVFPSRQAHSRKNKDNRRLDESRVWQIVHEAATRAGIAIDADGESKVSPHWLRHAHATHAQDAGAPIALVKETLGHKSIETTARYTHVRPNTSSSTFLRKRKDR